MRIARVGNHARGVDVCTPAHGPATGARAPIGVALHAVPCGRSNDSRSGPRAPDAPNLRVPGALMSSDRRTRPRIRGHAGSPISADTPAPAPVATARKRSVRGHTGKKCSAEQGFREFRQRASPHRPTRARDQCPVSRGTSRSPRSPAPHHIQGESNGSATRARIPSRRLRAPPLPERKSQCKRRPRRRGWPHPSDALSVHPPRAVRPGPDMERRVLGCAPQASWPAWPRPSGSWPPASPAPP
jgi:hypothetical protein